MEAKRTYFRLNTDTDEVFQDLPMLPEEADRLNEKLEADGSEFRWVPYGQRKEDVAA